MIYAIWNDGNSPDSSPEKLETFNNLDEARAALESRCFNGYDQTQRFQYVHRPACFDITPYVIEGSTYMDIFFELDADTFLELDDDFGLVRADHAPDVVLAIGI